MPSAANRRTWARCTKRCGWLLAFAQDCRVTRSSGDKATKGARLLMGKIIRERVKYVKLFMTHYTSLAGPKVIARIGFGIVAAATAHVRTGAFDKNVYGVERTVPYAMSGIKIKQVAGLAVCRRLGECAGNIIAVIKRPGLRFYRR